jgi:hypothetical protein
MTFFRTKSLGQEVLGGAQRLVGQATGSRRHQWMGTARQYAGQAGSLASQAVNQAGHYAGQAVNHAGRYAGQAGSLVGEALTHPRRHVRKHPAAAIAWGAGIGVAAIAAAWYFKRRQRLAVDDYDEHDPTRQRATNASGDALDGSGEDNPVPGDGGLY